MKLNIQRRIKGKQQTAQFQSCIDPNPRNTRGFYLLSILVSAGKTPLVFARSFKTRDSPQTTGVSNRVVDPEPQWIRINLSCWIRIQEGKNDLQIQNKVRPGGGKFLSNKYPIFFQLQFFLLHFLVIKTLDRNWIRIRNQEKCWIRIRIKLMRIHNPDFKCLKTPVYQYGGGFPSAHAQ